MTQTSEYSKPNNLTQRPLAHYGQHYRSLDPLEVSRRTGLAFDAESSAFKLALMGVAHSAGFPGFSLVSLQDGSPAPAYEQILILRYLCEGRFMPATGKELAYSELPWGNVYSSNFDGRVKRRLLREFAQDFGAFRRIMEENDALCPQRLDKCDCGYRFEFMDGLPLSIRFWAADEEFPASVQVLFDENFQHAFTAEDVAVVGDTVINRLTGMRGKSVS